jgi:hypothetical protein
MFYIQKYKFPKNLNVTIKIFKKTVFHMKVI